MKRIMLIGQSQCGKTSLVQRLQGDPMAYHKTQALDYCDYAIDTPGEYLENRGLYSALITTSCDADVVVDVHADTEAIVHLYTETPYWPQAETLARCLGSEVNLLARGSGVACSFDEACSQPWWRLADTLPPDHPLPLACLAVTLELRGQTDVDEKLAQEDAARLLAFLRHRGVLRGEPPPLPPLPFPPTPLAGSETVRADRAGLVTFLRPLGDWVDAGEPVCELLDPISGTRSTRRASVAGRVYARTTQRYAMLGMELVKIAGSTPFRTGALLTA